MTDKITSVFAWLIVALLGVILVGLLVWAATAVWDAAL